MVRVNSRQVHLDFHASELIPDVGSQFSIPQFQVALKAGHVNSITVFAKCHHSWSYYPTKVGRAHPALKIDLLGAQIEACHEIGVRAPIYYTVGWSATDAETHPEWTMRHKDGTIVTRNYDLKAPQTASKPITSWKYLCPSGTYKEHILAQTREICELYDVDGFFFDICEGPICYCANCRAGMAAAGIDVDDPEGAQAYNIRMWVQFMAEANALVHSYHPEASIFYNGTTKMGGAPEPHEMDTHYELEDLPTTWGGYDKFPLRARFFAPKGKPLLAMSGKFHTTWGEFGGFKHPEAIRFEAAAMIAYGARCSFGDQLHPSGLMDMATYENIGQAYAYVEKIEEFGLESMPYSNLGIWLCNSIPDDQGVANMLLETQRDFEVVDPAGDLGRFRTIILPGGPCLSEADAQKLRAFAAQGGTLLALGASPLDARKERFLLDVGATYVGLASYEMDYIVAGPALRAGLVSSPVLCYSAALRTQPTDGQVLAAIKEPYFDRTYGHYCSHQNTPNKPEDAAHPGALRKGNMVYLPHALGAIYYEHGARLHRDLFTNALNLIYQKPTLSVQMPSAGHVSLLHQPERRRYVAHLLYGPPLQRGRCLVIEDLVPLFNIPLALRVSQPIRRAWLPLDKLDLQTECADSVVRVTVPQVHGHQIVVFEY